MGDGSNRKLKSVLARGRDAEPVFPENALGFGFKNPVGNSPDILPVQSSGGVEKPPRLLAHTPDGPYRLVEIVLHGLSIALKALKIKGFVSTGMHFLPVVAP